MAEILLVNPRRRKRRKTRVRRRKSRATRRRRRSRAVAAPRRRRNMSHRRVSRRRRSNPSMRGILGRIQPAVKAGLVGAAGGLGLSVALGYLSSKLPAQLQSGYGNTAVRVLGAILVGVLGDKVLRGKGSALATGAMTVVAYTELQKLMAAQFPSVPLGDYLSFAPVVGYDYPQGTEMGEYVDSGAGMGMYNGMGEYASESDDQGGY